MLNLREISSVVPITSNYMPPGHGTPDPHFLNLLNNTGPGLGQEYGQQ